MRVSSPPSDLELVVADTPLELARVRRFRTDTYRTRSGIELDDDPAVDERAIVFALRRECEIVATGRVLPLPDAGAGINDFAPHPSIVGAAELGRLAVARGQDPSVLLTLVGRGAAWLLEHTDLDSYVAYCHPRLVAGYHLLGAREVAVEQRHPSSGRRYRFVAGRFADALTPTRPVGAEPTPSARSAA